MYVCVYAVEYDEIRQAGRAASFLLRMLAIMRTILAFVYVKSIV